MSGASSKRNGALKLPMSFEDALKAALEVKPKDKKPPPKKAAKKA
jgi:hypothetical protein